MSATNAKNKIDYQNIAQNQPTINIGMLGHVSHGKSQSVKTLSGKKTQAFSSEKQRDITIKLGYANAKIWKCNSCNSYKSTNSTNRELQCEKCNKSMTLRKHISLVDCPGHEIYMTTMLNGTAIMDAALFLVSAANDIPQPQTCEHLLAADIMHLRDTVILLNKLDIVSQKIAKQRYQETKQFIKGTIAEYSNILPVSAYYGINFDLVCEYIDKMFVQPPRNLEAPPQLVVIRSFDVNPPGTKPEKLIGGAAGGSLKQGVLKVGQTIQICPGVVYKTTNGIEYEPLTTTITGLFSEKNKLEYAIPGGLISIGTNLDSSLFRKDRLVGQIVGIPGHMPNVYEYLEIKFKLVKILLGSTTKENIKQLGKGEEIRLNVQSCNVQAKVINILKKGVAQLQLLNQVVCVPLESKVSICRNFDNRWRLIGFGTIKKGVLAKVKTQ